MARKEKLQVTASENMIANLENFAAWRGISKSAVVTLALQEYFDAHADWMAISEAAQARFEKAKED